MNYLEKEWSEQLAPLFPPEQLDKLMQTVEEESRTHTIFPPQDQIFRAFTLTPYSKVRAVILGQDPYYRPGQATGLAFSVPDGVRLPPSLRNIFKELQADCGITPPKSGDLTRWAENGVLLLNTALTVREGAPNSHRKLWLAFTDAVLDALDAHPEPLVFLLWGNPAREKKAHIKNPRHLILEAAHPSPLSAANGFFGCRHFSAAAEFLAQNGTPMDWSVLTDHKENL